MSSRAIAVTTAVSGFGFVALFIIGAAVYANGAGSDGPEIVAYYANPANRAAQIEGFFVVTAALAFFAFFVASIRSLVARAEPWSTLTLTAGTATLICLLIANTLWASSAFTTVIEHDYAVDPRTHLMFEDSGFTFVVAGGVMAAAFVVATSVLVLKDRGFPRWVGWLGVPVAGSLLAAYWYLPVFAFFVWIVVIGMVGLVRRRRVSAEKSPSRAGSAVP
jgi:hypothetical protein